MIGGSVLTFAGTLLGVAVLLAVMLELAPGDAIDTLPNGEELRPILEAEWALDRPVHERLATWLFAMARGDLGTSLTYRPGMPVSELLWGPALRSAGWVIAAVTTALAAGTAMAWTTAGYPARSRLLVQALSVAPVFVLAHLLVTGFNSAAWTLMLDGSIARPGWFPLPDPSPLRTTLAIGVLAIGSGTLTEVHSDLETALVRIQNSGYIDAARARGESLLPHVAWNLLPPLLGVLSTRMAFLVGGVVILERVFLLNGAGSILWSAALARDWPVALGVGLLAAGSVAATRLVCDLGRLAIDPRAWDLA